MKENKQSNSTETNRTTIDIEDIMVLIDKTENKEDRGDAE